MTIKKGFKFKEVPKKSKEQATAEALAEEFLYQLNLFHSQPSPRDNSLEIYLHQCYADVLRRNVKNGFNTVDKPYFSPSGSGSCARELYCKAKGLPRDNSDVKPYQTRWQHIGTKIGDMIQEQVLLMEYHLENLTGVAPSFKFVRNEYGEPAFEEFVYCKKLIDDRFYLMGTTDGILETEIDGKKVKVGLEIKSKQTSYSQTGYYSMKEANEKHRKQTVAYSLMYDVDYWIVVYVNASKKSWSMATEDIEKYPDIRAFGHYVTQEEKDQLLNKFRGIMDAVDNNTPPELDLLNWTFNNYKVACSLDLSQEEFNALIDKAIQFERSDAPAYIVNGVISAIEFISATREREGL